MQDRLFPLNYSESLPKAARDLVPARLHASAGFWYAPVIAVGGVFFFYIAPNALRSFEVQLRRGRPVGMGYCQDVYGRIFLRCRDL